MRLKANKTSLYKLVAEHQPLPSMKKTQFCKAPRSRSYFLHWYNDAIDEYCKAFFSICGGIPSLGLTIGSEWHLQDWHLNQRIGISPVRGLKINYPIEILPTHF